MLVDGHQRDESFQRKTGYVQQQDLHLETSTVREALSFSALLRQSAKTPKEEKLAYVEEVIKLLEMEAYADAVVGVPGEGKKFGTGSYRNPRKYADFVKVSTLSNESGLRLALNWLRSRNFSCSLTNQLPAWIHKPLGPFSIFSKNSRTMGKPSCALFINLPPCFLIASTAFCSSSLVARPFTLVPLASTPAFSPIIL